MKLSTALFCGLVALATAWSLAEAYVAHDVARVQNGKCFYKDVIIDSSATYFSESPCESWQCNVGDASVTVFGCIAAGAGDNCKLVPGEGVYPNCCPQPICS